MQVDVAPSHAPNMLYVISTLPSNAAHDRSLYKKLEASGEPISQQHTGVNFSGQSKFVHADRGVAARSRGCLPKGDVGAFVSWML